MVLFQKITCWFNAENDNPNRNLKKYKEHNVLLIKITNRTIASLFISFVNQILVHSNNTEYHIFFSNTHQFRYNVPCVLQTVRSTIEDCFRLFPWTAPDLTVGFISFQLHQGDIRISGCYQPVAGKMVFNILEARNIPRVSILGAVSTYDQHTAWTKWIMIKYLNHQHAS